MKTSILVILFLFCSQILSQIESIDIINHRDFLKERMNHSTNPLIQSESSFEANIFQNNDSRRTVNKTALNDEFCLTEQIQQIWNDSNWLNLRACFGIGCDMPGGRHTYLYNESNNLIEDLWQDWDNSNWINFWKNTYTYDANNNMIEELSQYWDESSWINWKKYTYTYDVNNNMKENLRQEWDASIWVNDWKNIYTYDANNNMIEDLRQNWDDSNWVIDYKRTYAYDANNNMIENLRQDWDGSNWVNGGKRTFIYDANKNMIEDLYQRWDDLSWVNVVKNTYTYDENNNMIEDLYQYWNVSSWVNNWRNIYTYDANNNMIEDLWQYWDGASWGDPPWKNIYTYDANNNMIEELYQQRDGSSLANYSRIIYSYQSIFAQSPEWITYNTTNSGLPDSDVFSIAIDENGNKWIGTFSGGLAKFDDTNPGGVNWTVYNSFNSGLPDNTVNCIATNSNGNVWIGTGSFFTPLTPNDGGLAKFDDTTWSVYNTFNSGLPSYEVRSIAIDGSGNKWIGTLNGGLAKFDDTTWTIYNTSNSGLPGNSVRSLAIDISGNIWIGTASGLVKFDGTNPEGAGWTVYNTSNSGLPANYVSFIDIDGSGNKWIGTNGGLAKFDNANWTVYNTSNSGLPDNFISSIAIDEAGTKWLGTYGGLAVYKEGGVVPMELTSFTALVNGKEAILNWSTATELNNQGFEVQRRFGNSEFATVGSAKGHGTTTSPNNYTYFDKLIDAGKYFYRLKQIDFDGTFEYSNEIEVEVRVLDKFMLEQNYPNPFNPTTTIKYSIPKLSFVTIKIYDVLGSEVASLVNEEKLTGTYEVEFNSHSDEGQNLTSGVYFYRLKAGNFIDTKKMILLK